MSREGLEENLVAEYDLLRAQIADLQGEISSAQAELTKLQPRHQKILETIKLYGLENRLEDNANEENRLNALLPSGKGEVIAYEVKQFLFANDNAWTRLSEIYEYLLTEKIHVGGKNPISTLSAHLSNSGEFENARAKGWRLDKVALHRMRTHRAARLQAERNIEQRKKGRKK